MKKSEAGQGLVDYPLILALVALVVIMVLVLVGPILGDQGEVLCDWFLEYNLSPPPQCAIFGF